MKKARTSFLFCFSCLLAAPVVAQTISGGSCSAANLNGTYSLTLSGRALSAAGSFAGSFQGIGLVTFDGVNAITLTGTANTNLALGKPFQYSGTYTVPSNCLGTVTLTTGSTATFTLAVWSSGSQYDITGSDSTYVYSGSGSSNLPTSCATASISGEYSYDAAGFTLSGTAQTASADEAGVLQFDGQGNVTMANYTITSSGTTPTALTATGTYTVGSNCVASATLTDSAGKSNALNMVITGDFGQNFLLLEANSGYVRSGAAHSAFTNPTQSIVNAASYAINATPAGSVFALFGNALAATGKTASALNVPLPPTLLSTKVTVNGETAPLFYVDSGQINAQMPWDIPGGKVASVVVTNGAATSGSGTSNAAAVYVPASGTPGLSFYGNNRAVVVNTNGNVNTPTDAAAVGDEVVAYFTGGGPVQAAGALVTGAASPAGLSPVPALNSTVTVGGMNAIVKYIGLTPGGVGLYQVNFLVPQIVKGTYPVVLTISGQASNTLGGPNPNPLMTVSN
jgi:uncharacterized protein (TIGR03437 family)